MNGLLQRLVSQARGAGSAAAGAGVRPAMSVHAQVPLGSAAAASPMLPNPEPRELATWPGALGILYKSDPGQAERAQTAPIEISSSSRDGATAASEPVKAHTQERAERAAAPTADTIRVRNASIPQPLLAEAVAPSLPPMISAALMNQTHQPDSQVRLEASREPTEVHVHIGRIEVIAASEPAAPKKAAARAPRHTAPLAEYLAKKARP